MMDMKNAEFMGHQESQLSNHAETSSDWRKDNLIGADPHLQYKKRERLHMGIISIRNEGITH